MPTTIGPKRLARLDGEIDRAPAYKGLHDKLQQLNVQGLHASHSDREHPRWGCAGCV